MPPSTGGAVRFHTQLKPHEEEDGVTDGSAVAMVQQAIGAPLEVEVWREPAWPPAIAGAERCGAGGSSSAATRRPFHAHRRLGYNTAIEDAGTSAGSSPRAQGARFGAPARELRAELPRSRCAIPPIERLRRFARHRAAAADRGRHARGREARRRAGEYSRTHGRTEFNIPGITFADATMAPAIVSDGSVPPPDTANAYVPTACPGAGAAPLAATQVALRQLRIRMDASAPRGAQGGAFVEAPGTPAWT